VHLKSLEIAGFKSFARKTDLEFTTAITGIVGPNGSGKSNVAEAFRFVLGEQSIKSLRGKRGEDLIFNGSPSQARANRASVKIVLDNSKKVFPVDFEEVTIERVVNRDGVNEYLINGSRTRLKDVQELLASANIGPTGHHIISQGEADRILSSSPKERREMIEDALGLKVYQYKKAESERKLEKTVENIAQVESLRREVAPHLRFLEKQIKKMERALELRNDLGKFYAEYLRREDEYLAFHNDRLVEARREPTAQLAELEERLLRAKEKLATAEKDEKRDALVALEGKIREAREERQNTLREIGKVEGQVTYLERAIADLERGTTDASSIVIPLTRVSELIAQAEHDAERVEHISDLDEARAAIRAIVEKLRAFVSEASQGTVRDEARIATFTEELDILRKTKERNDALIADVESREAALRDEYEALKRAIEAEASESRSAEREVFEIMGKERDLEARIAEIDRDMRVIERDRIEFKREIEEAMTLIGRAAADYFSVELKDEAGNPLTREMIATESRETQENRRRELEKMKIRLEELGGAGGEDVVKEYNDAKARDEFLAKEIADLEASVQSLKSLIEDLTKELNTQFVTGIEKISAEFNTFFGMMFQGGTGALMRVQEKKRGADDDLEDGAEEKEIEEGIEIDVKLPHKRIRGLEMLSGGERALTSIALIFAMSQVNPPLFVILDETDAALDEANSKRYGDMVSALAERSQLILITHNRETMSRAGVLYGVTMGADGVSKLLSVKFDEAVSVAK
jgi:chromosome segregation protein